MFVKYYIVVHSCNHCCCGNATINALINVVSVDVDVNNIKVFSVAMDMQQWVPFALLLSNKYIIPLLTVLNIMSLCLYSCCYLACMLHIFCTVLYCLLWPVWLYHIFPHYLINGTIKKKKILNIECVLIFSASFV